MRTVRNERGVALAVSIFALVVIGALVAGAFFMGMQEQRIGRNTIQFQQAFSAAEEGANRQVANWATATNNALANGDSLTFAGTVVNARGWYRGTIRRLNDLLFFVRSEGFSFDSAARQHVGLLVRLRPLEVSIRAALVTQGELKIGGSSQLDGNDHVPAGWTCPGLEPPLPGIMITDEDDISTVGCSGYICVEGSPKVAEDSTITTESLTTFGDLDFDELKSMATKIVTPGVRKIEPSVMGADCNISDMNNWGSPLDPTGPCANYWPIVWVDGDLTINGVQGQGILLVDGNLSVGGGFEFLGPVIIRGELKTGGTGGHFQGGVIAANVNLAQSSVLGDAVVEYSSCAVAKALQNTAAGSLLTERSWVNLY